MKTALVRIVTIRKSRNSNSRLVKIVRVKGVQ